MKHVGTHIKPLSDWGIACLAIFSLSLWGVIHVNQLAQPYFAHVSAPLLPKGYQKNAHTRQSVSQVGAQYHYAYTFQDQGGQLHTWKWQQPQAQTDSMAAQYGVPPSIYEPFQAKPEVLAKRKRLIQQGLFKKEGQYVRPDRSRMAHHYMALLSPLYAQYQATCTEQQLSQLDQVQLLLNFCQDIPYGIPPRIYEGRFINGLFPPPLTLTKQWGDCDTKCVLFASLLGQEPAYNLVFIDFPGHLLIGIEGIPRPYDDYVIYRGRKFICLEPVGPAHTRIGKASAYAKREPSYIEPMVKGGSP